METPVVGLESKVGRLRLRVPMRFASNGVPRYISLQLEDTLENREIAQAHADRVAALLGSDGAALAIAQLYPKIRKPPQIQELTLDEIWARYCQHKEPQLAQTYYKLTYCRSWKNRIAELPQRIREPKVIRQALISINTLDTARRVWIVIKAASRWAEDEGLITTDYFQGLRLDVKSPKGGRVIDPFSVTERDRILETFAELRSEYYPFVRFLFLTGCRIGEAIALQWDRVASDLSSVTFAETYNEQLQIRKTTKTGKIRRFPCNPSLQALLKSLPQEVSKGLVFPAPQGGYISNTNFTNRVWRGEGKYKGLVSNLVLSGGIQRYRKPYNTRHTFITLMMASGQLTISQIAALVGNSPDVILKHYAGAGVDEVPDI